MPLPASRVHRPLQVAIGHFGRGLELRSVGRQVRRYEKARSIAQEVFLPALDHFFNSRTRGELDHDATTCRLWFGDKLRRDIRKLRNAARKIQPAMQSF